MAANETFFIFALNSDNCSKKGQLKGLTALVFVVAQQRCKTNQKLIQRCINQRYNMGFFGVRKRVFIVQTFSVDMQRRFGWLCVSFFPSPKNFNVGH